MTKRELNTLIRQHVNGVSKDVCQTAIIQLCCPSIKRKEINALIIALEYFESHLLASRIKIYNSGIKIPLENDEKE